MKNLVEIKNLKMKYAVKSGFSEEKNEFINAVNDVDLKIQEGEILGIVGESGCGKSTLGKCILRLESGYSGQILFDGVDISEKKNLKNFRKSAQMIFQNPYASLNPRMRIYDILKEPLVIHGEKNSKIIRQKIEEVCELTGIDKSALNYYPHEFSGGQRQRISIARALTQSYKILLFDEPTSALDPISTLKIEELMEELKKKYTVVVVTHNMQQAARVSDYTAFFLVGEVVEFDTTDNIFSRPKDKRTEDYITGRFG